MVEKRMDQSFLRIFESYGYSKEAVTNKNIFDQLDDCDRTASRVSKKLNESNIKKTVARRINESMFGGKPLTKEQLVLTLGGNAADTSESDVAYESLLTEGSENSLRRADFIILTGEAGTGNVTRAKEALRLAGVKFRMATYDDIVSNCNESLTEGAWGDYLDNMKDKSNTAYKASQVHAAKARTYGDTLTRLPYGDRKKRDELWYKRDKHQGAAAELYKSADNCYQDYIATGGLKRDLASKLSKDLAQKELNGDKISKKEHLAADTARKLAASEKRYFNQKYNIPKDVLKVHPNPGYYKARLAEMDDNYDWFRNYL